eukprot:SAG11_NODE_367_length_10114_cov_16.930904_1_plen_46_part_00
MIAAEMPLNNNQRRPCELGEKLASRLQLESPHSALGKTWKVEEHT